MTFEEYIDTDVFRQERERLCANRRTAKRRMILFFVGLALLLIGGILLPEEGSAPLWRDILGYSLFGAGMAVTVIGAILSRRTDDRMEDSMMRRPAFAAAFFLYARQYLAADWRAENGVVCYEIDLPVTADKDVSHFTLVRGGERTEISLAPFGEHLDALDVLAVAVFGLFTWLERENVVAQRISYRLLENGVGEVGKKGEVVLYEAGKWRFAGRTQRREYRRIVKYARKKDLIG